LDNFSGWATYRIQFQADSDQIKWLDLGAVHETVEVNLNGRELGAVWYGPRRFEISDYVKAGANDLEICVGTLLFNYARSLEDNKNVQFFVGRSQTQEPLPTGLVGPVTLSE